MLPLKRKSLTNPAGSGNRRGVIRQFKQNSSSIIINMIISIIIISIIVIYQILMNTITIIITEGSHKQLQARLHRPAGRPTPGG